MDARLQELFDTRRALTTTQVLTVVSRGTLRGLVRHGVVVPLFHGTYAMPPVTLGSKLTALNVAYGRDVVACKETAAALYGFDTEGGDAIHILDPGGRHVHGHSGVVAHQSVEVPVRRVDGHLATTPAWTAIECARALSRPRALATLDAALRTDLCAVDDLRDAAAAQAGRRGIVRVRPLIELADGRAESPMESETRLVILDSALPRPDLQVPVLDDAGIPRFHLDLAWEAAKLAVEYDGIEFHTGALAVRRDKARIAWLQDRGWLIVIVTADDVRRWPHQLVRRLEDHLLARMPAA